MADLRVVRGHPTRLELAALAVALGAALAPPAPVTEPVRRPAGAGPPWRPASAWGPGPTVWRADDPPTSP